jgi:hypothetical protein
VPGSLRYQTITLSSPRLLHDALARPQLVHSECIAPPNTTRTRKIDSTHTASHTHAALNCSGKKKCFALLWYVSNWLALYVVVQQCGGSNELMQSKIGTRILLEENGSSSIA